MAKTKVEPEASTDLAQRVERLEGFLVRVMARLPGGGDLMAEFNDPSAAPAEPTEGEGED